MGVRREERMTMSVGDFWRIEVRPLRIGFDILRGGRGSFRGGGLEPSFWTSSKKGRERRLVQIQFSPESKIERESKEKEKSGEVMKPILVPELFLLTIVSASAAPLGMKLERGEFSQ